MEFLRAVGRFILTQLAILGFLLLAPAIFVGVSLFVLYHLFRFLRQTIRKLAEI